MSNNESISSDKTATSLDDEPAQQLRQASSPTRLFRKQIFLTIILIEIICLFWLLPKDTHLYNRIYQTFNSVTKPKSENDAELLKDDPGVGLALFSNSTPPPKITFPTSNKGFLLVPVGECAGCLAADLPTWSNEAKKQGLTMVLLTSATPARSKAFLKELGFSTPVIFDSDKSLSRRINTVWLARPYLFSPDWTLLWLSHQRPIGYNPFNDKDFQKVVQGIQK